MDVSILVQKNYVKCMRKDAEDNQRSYPYCKVAMSSCFIIKLFYI